MRKVKKLEDDKKAAAQRLLEAQEKEQRMQEKLRQLSNCPAGFAWSKQSTGWQCAGGGHFVSDAQLEAQFMF